MRKTKIICTIGPAVEDLDTLKDLMLNGMDCARLNFSHGDYEEHLKRINNIKKLRDELHLPIPILLDTKGPEIRICMFEHGSVEIIKGQKFIFDSNYTGLGNNEIVGLSYPIYTSVNLGTTILVDDGKLAFVVTEINDGKVITNALNSGTLYNRKSVNIPNVNIDMPYISDKDRNDILFGIEQGIDFLAASFVRTANDVLELRELLNENGGRFIKIISKVENRQGIENLDAIIKVSDGIMIARGDMGVEVPFIELPAIQKDIIKKCYRAGKYVITATQMLDSMTYNPRPTRAEVTDVANAIYDGTTITMLSGETAMGKYPIQSVKTMAEIAISTENDINYIKKFDKNHLDLGQKVMSAIANAACMSAHQLQAKAIIAVTRKGVTAQSIANYRPNTPIIAATPDERVYRQLNLSWNVYPILDQDQFKEDDQFDFELAIQKALQLNLINKDDMVVMAAGVKKSNLQTGILKIHKVE